MRFSAWKLNKPIVVSRTEKFVFWLSSTPEIWQVPIHPHLEMDSTSGAGSVSHAHVFSSSPTASHLSIDQCLTLSIDIPRVFVIFSRNICLSCTPYKCRRSRDFEGIFKSGDTTCAVCVQMMYQRIQRLEQRTTIWTDSLHHSTSRVSACVWKCF